VTSVSTSSSERAADAFFAASAAGDADGMRAAVAAGAVFWQNVDGSERDVEQVIRYVGKLRRTGGFGYHDVRRLAAADGFCEQHTVRFADGTEYAVCVVGRVDEAGRITRLDEYLDSKPGGTTSD
jgi:ketosteroid isomerase-like protein